MTIVASLIFLVIGIIIGFFAGRLYMGGKPENELENELERNRQEFDLYKEKVSDHFQQTANLLHGVASNYRELYNHMSAQSGRLLGDRDEKQNPFPKLPGMDDDEAINMPPPKDYSGESSGLLNGDFRRSR